MSTSSSNGEEVFSQHCDEETPLDTPELVHDEKDDKNEERPESECGDDSDDEVLRSIGTVEGEELLAFFDNVRSAYQIDTSSLSLPQLVVVGSTSCGKSSLLQGLTKLPFPVDNGICTLFATETMIHRCDPSVNPHYSITIQTTEPNDFVPREYSNESWSNVSLHLKSDLEDIFSQQHAKTNIPRRLINNKRIDRLHDQVMKVNVYKHDQAHFSVIDIPGLISGGSKSDQRLSENLARQYMSNPRAIILAVMPAVDDIHNQAVLRLAREEGAMKRTIGVVTKCDMLQKHDEAKTITLLKNQDPEHRLELGWFAVRNRTTEEIEQGLTYRERDEKEYRLFNQKPWSTLHTNFAGIANLKNCVSDIMYKHVKASFPAVQKDIVEKLQSAKHNLDLLGAARDSEKMQSLYLDDVQRKFEDLAQKRLSGLYDDCSLDHPSRLRYHLDKLVGELQKTVEEDGIEHRYPTDEEFGKRINELEYKESPADWEAKILAPGDIFSWMLRFWNENRGDGLWYIPPQDYENRLWKSQIKSWNGIASNFLFKTRQLIQAFSDSLLEELCPDKQIYEKIRNALQAQKDEAILRAEQELDAILSEIGRMNTYDRSYVQRVQQKHQDWNAFLETCDIKLRYIGTTFFNLTAFQDLAQWRFVDNVMIQVVERHLLGPSGLIFCFSSKWIRNLSGLQLDDLVGEDEGRKRTRADLQTEIKELDQILGQAQALQYR
ncbi:hypothetical protein N7520_002746 [Penicillium odoratum]|uniref:uncharacterized protein n=1 Tax=Penicillium odoratum TaxID=1167516 RepID=UPI002548A20F|nr:uncharacterized protein N7520_002746 [Penicillium odoratum]KAJ5772217.1 hypothetical protein N7520_002746 [Penicillium odoratum]